MKFSLRNRLLWGALLLTIQLSGQNMHFDKDGMAVINGQRRFILGLYEYPADDQLLQQVANAGFNIIGVGAKDSLTTNQSLNRLAVYHLGAWISGNFDLSADREKRQANMQKMVRRFASNQALWAWEVPDEALWNVSTVAWEYRVHQEIKLFRKELGEIRDTIRKAAMAKAIDSIVAAYYDGDFSRGQQSADSIWRGLGKSAPKADMDLTMVTHKSDEVAKGITAGYQYLKQLDPHRPVFMNHAPRNQLDRLTSFSRPADVIGCDIYPVPEYLIQHSDLADLSLSCVGNYTRRMRQAAGRKPVWMVLQGFGWCDLRADLAEEERMKLRRPNLKESRFMAWDAIANGARGINYWGTYLIPKDGALWQDLLKVVGELNELQPVLSAPDGSWKLSLKVEENFNSFDRPILLLQKKLGEKCALIVVNENQNRSPVFYQITGLDQWNGKSYREKMTGKQLSINNGCLRVPIVGQTAQIWIPME